MRSTLRDFLALLNLLGVFVPFDDISDYDEYCERISKYYES